MQSSEMRTHPYLVVDEGGPEASGGALVGVGGEDGRADEQLVDVLHDDERLADGLAIVDEHGHLLVHGVGREEEFALVEWQVLLDVLVAHALDAQRHAHPDHERAHLQAEQLQILLPRHRNVSLY